MEAKACKRKLEELLEVPSPEQTLPKVPEKDRYEFHPNLHNACREFKDLKAVVWNPKALVKHRFQKTCVPTRSDEATNCRARARLSIAKRARAKHNV